MLGAASVIGREFDTGLLAEIAGESADAVLEALEPAERARLIGDAPGRPGRYSFAHALVRTVLADELGTNRRVRLHRCRGCRRSAARPAPGELAYHFGEAAVMGETDRAVRYARAAAEQALRLAAPEEAVTFARRALDAACSATLPTRNGPVCCCSSDGRSTDPERSTRPRTLSLTCTRVRLRSATLKPPARRQSSTDQATASFSSTTNAARQLRAALASLPSGDSLLRAGVWRDTPSGSPVLPVTKDYSRTRGLRHGRPGRRTGRPPGRRERGARMVTSIDPAAQLRFSEEALAIAVAGSGGARLEPTGRLAQARLVFGDLEGADAAIADMDAAFERAAFGLSPVTAPRTWTLDSWRIVRALIAGRFADAEAIVADRRDAPRKCRRAFGAANGRARRSRTCAETGRAQPHAGPKYAASCRPPTEPYFGYLGTGGDIDDLRSTGSNGPRSTRLRPAWTSPRQHWRARRKSAPAGGAGRGRCTPRRVRRPLRLLLHQRDRLVLRPLRHRARHPRRDRRRPRQCARAPRPSRPTMRRDRVAHLGRDRTARARYCSSGSVAHPATRKSRSQAIAHARHAMTDFGMPGWLERLELLDAGDLQPWRI